MPRPKKWKTYSITSIIVPAEHINDYETIRMYGKAHGWSFSETTWHAIHEFLKNHDMPVDSDHADGVIKKIQDWKNTPLGLVPDKDGFIKSGDLKDKIEELEEFITTYTVYNDNPEVKSGLKDMSDLVDLFKVQYNQAIERERLINTE